MDLNEQERTDTLNHVTGTQQADQAHTSWRFQDLDDIMPDMTNKKMTFTELLDVPMHGFSESDQLPSASAGPSTSQVQVNLKKKRGRPKGSTNKNKRVKPVTPESPAAKAAKKLSQRSRLFTTPSQRRPRFNVPLLETQVQQPAEELSLFDRRNELRSPPPASPAQTQLSAEATPRRAVSTPAADPGSQAAALGSDDEAIERELLEGEGEEVEVFTESKVKALIKVMVPHQAAYKTAKTTAEKREVWTKIEEELLDKGVIADAVAIRRKFNSLLNRYKEVKDNNNQSGRDRMTFKYEDDFDNAYRLIDTREIETTVDESGEPAEMSVSKRKRPKGRGNPMEELKLDLIREDVQNRKEFMARIISIEERKLALLERMATQGGNTQ